MRSDPPPPSIAGFEAVATILGMRKLEMGSMLTRRAEAQDPPSLEEEE
jgi:hypothetical protein